ncbi:IclR family transcriptional regulator [Buttiauxella warmboldiae]|uniref:IclR family transcriptional regulator n=1 Tax=Buttiauxella warmboldiae TaxID=82993 RepID=A0A3N5EEC8_9ENTR|nr:IclR family transcriptional regulator [Buttiauxella warmboldiae]RPH30166.1 IclR family transcriptional regulator [Buttiauxella warmboldiae]
MQSKSNPGEQVKAQKLDKRQSSADKTLELLIAIGDLGCENNGQVRLMELVRHTGHPRPTVHRLLGELKRFNLVSQDEETNCYSLGHRLLVLSAQCLGELDIRQIAQAELRRFVDKIGQTAHLGIRDEQWVVYIDKVEPRSGIQLSSQIGIRRPITTTSLGKSILAYSADEIVSEIIAKGLSARTIYSITDPIKFREELSVIAKRGFALDLEECDLGIVCASAPLFNYKNEPIAAISITMIKSQVNSEQLIEIGSSLRVIADIISEKIKLSRKKGI